jgi:signal transduction histidine kinase
MKKKLSDKLQSLSILLPIILLIFTTVVGYLLYSIDMKGKQSSFPKQFNNNKLSESILIRSAVSEWLKRGNTGIAQSIIGNQHTNKDIIGITIIDVTQKVLVSTQDHWVHLPFTPKNLKLSNQAYAQLLSNLNKSLKGNTNLSFFSPDHKILLILLPVSLSNNGKGTMILCYNFFSAEQGMIAKYRNTGFLYLMVLLFSTIGLGIILYHIIIARLNKLIRVMDSFSKGNYDDRIITKGLGEVSLLYEQFNRLATALKTEIAERIQIEKSLRERELELKKSNKEYLIINEELSEKNDEIVAMYKDLITAKDKAEESDRLKTAFLANVSHEIRTPMNAIIGFSDLLDDESMDNDTRKLFTHTIKTRSADLLNIINDILDISKLESGLLKIDAFSGSVSQILNELISYYNTKNKNISKKPIIFNLRYSLIPEHDYIITDFNRLKQVLMNLIDNAFKFTSEGLIEIGCKEKDSNTLLFYVKDTGIGIPSQKLELIFERFRQATDSYLSSKFGGTGLGLSISKGLIELMEGEIWVESTEGKGTTFFFTTPLKLKTPFFNFSYKKNRVVF